MRTRAGMWIIISPVEMLSLTGDFLCLNLSIVSCIFKQILLFVVRLFYDFVSVIYFNGYVYSSFFQYFIFYG